MEDFLDGNHFIFEKKIPCKQYAAADPEGGWQGGHGPPCPC